jgi:NADH dehydrogenase FAD-containing subunit
LRKLVILGGGFCGALVAKKLDSRRTIDTTLIDKKDFFEYTPAVHRAIFEPDYQSKITVPFHNFLKHISIVTDDLIQVNPQFVETRKKNFYYDILVISTGIDYPIFLKNKNNVFTLTCCLDARAIHDKIRDVSRTLVIGGGLIGTEIAGELVTKSSNKVVIVHPHERLIERNPVKASRYAQKFLEKHGAKIIFGEQIVEHENGTFVTDKEKRIEANVAIWCAGIKCDPWFMKDFPKTIFTDRNALKVNEYLQLDGFPYVFVGGDINSVKEEKTAANAERHARLIVRNIDRMLKNKPLIPYEESKDPLVISLGNRDGVIVFRKLVITGLLPRIVKYLIAWWILREYKWRALPRRTG